MVDAKDWRRAPRVPKVGELLTQKMSTSGAGQTERRQGRGVEWGGGAEKI